MSLAAVDVGADPEIDADGAGVEIHTFFAVVHVLEVLVQQGYVDNLTGDKIGVVESGGEGLGIGVGAVTLKMMLLGMIQGELWGMDGGRTSCGAILDFGGA